jgi:hypothetical protein
MASAICKMTLRHCEERSDAAIQSRRLRRNWIASSQVLLAMTGGACVAFMETFA